MKRMLLLTAFAWISLRPIAQEKNMDKYTAAWQTVTELIEKKNLPESALKEVMKIHTMAKKDRNEAQELKALLYMGRLAEENTEEAGLTLIRNLEKELKLAGGIRKSLLHSMLASAYWQYLQENRWSLYDRTGTKEKGEDVRTWTATDLHTEISKHYLLSLEDKKKLQATRLEGYEALIRKGNRRELRPTLYDLTAHAALDYFHNSERDLQKNGESFEINDPAAFAPAAEFSKHDFKIQDEASLYGKAVLIYQDLIRQHLSDKKPDALIDLDLGRLRFMREHSVSEDKDQAYASALAGIRDRYPQEPASAQAAFLKASLDMSRDKELRENAGSRNAGNDMIPRIRKECEEIVKKFPGTEGAVNCEKLLQEIDRRELSLQVEKVNIPAEPFRCLVQFRNISKVHYRIIQLTDSMENRIPGRGDDKYWNHLRGMKPYRTSVQELPVTTDMRSHAAEIRIEGLPAGRYALLAGTDAELTGTNMPLSVIYFHVSAIAWINRGTDYFVLDRQTGKPLTSASVVVWKQRYDYDTRNFASERSSEHTTDLDGYFQLPDPGIHFESVRLEVSWKGDRLFMKDTEYRAYSDDREWTNNREEYESRYRRLFLFTDRSIYRPGQTVHFKGIMVTRDFDTRRPRVIAGHDTRILLYNANGEETDTLDLKTGEYGSFSGTFRLPEGGLTGGFRIEEEKGMGMTYFNVEEYKRPTFQVEWKKVEKEYRVNEEVTVNGTAMAYAGNSINGAKVRYRVTRVTRFPYPWYYFGYGMPREKSVEIAHGETETAADGSFSVRFRAVPDKSADKTSLPVFEYRVSADVTDMSGESRSGEEYVSVGYHTLSLSLLTGKGKTLSNEKDAAIGISATNLSGIPQTVQAKITMYPLEGPDRLIRPRYWNAPDTFVMTEKEYIRHFPYDEYANETKRESWKKGKALFEHMDTVKGEASSFNLPIKNLAPGWYRIEAESRDAGGQAVKAVEDIEVMDHQTGQTGRSGYFSHRLSLLTAQPGQTSALQLSTTTDDLWVIEHLDGYKGSIIQGKNTGKISDPRKAIALPDPVHPYRLISLDRGSKSFDLPITEDDRGGFGVSHAFVKHNRFFSYYDIVQVPWKNKELDISFTTYRDKTLPGSKEDWSVTVKGSKGEQVASEILMSMYDASLDQFMPHEWRKPDLFEVYPARFDRYLLKPWTAALCFHAQESEVRNYREKNLKAIDKRYDALLWQGANGSGIMPRMRAYSRGDGPVKMMAMKPPVVADMQAVSDSTPIQIRGNNSLIMSKQEETLQEVVMTAKGKTDKKPQVPVQIRKDFRETAFFLPDLRTDAAGNVTFSFTMPDALTQWKWQMLAHTKDLSMGLATRSIVTQKELMVQPNAPRFLREGDQITLTARIANLTGAEMSGEAELQVTDTESGQVVDGLFNNIFPKQYFTAPAREGTVVNFNLTVPGNYSRPVTYRIIAKSKEHSDGEEKVIPVLSNRMLITESLPMQLKGTEIRTFSFDKLLRSGSSPSLTHHRLTLEYSTNPAWYAVQSLPYLTTYPYDCAEQVFNKFYANAMASKVAASTPKIRAYYEKWQKEHEAGQTGALTGNLSKNQELKNILLEETPWVMEAKDEDRQRRDIALLFDMARLSGELDFSIARLRQYQSPNGGFVWFHGGPENRYITQYILTGMGRLQKAGAIPDAYIPATEEIIDRGLDYLRKRLREDYDKLIKGKADMKQQHIGNLQIQCLYTFSCFPEKPIEAAYKPAYDFFSRQARQFWMDHTNQLQGMIALFLKRSGDQANAMKIINSLRERAVKNENLGMYWKAARPAWYWQDAPVETQALLIEAFSEVAGDETSVAVMKQWLLTQKQTNRWESTKATADACYALLMRGDDWLNAERTAEISVGSVKPLVFSSTKDAETGTGYFKSVVDGQRVEPDMGNITVTVKGTGKKENGSISWGAAYWQYFERMDRITASASPLSIEKKLFVERNTEKGPVLEPVPEGASYRVGDKLKVRIVLRSDRDMEFVHLKDMRPSGSEPVNVLSGYKWQGALGYYESTRDAATNFFFSYVPKGTYVFEYPIFITHEGRFSSGVASVECMYAPEFRANSEGIGLRVTK